MPETDTPLGVDEDAARGNELDAELALIAEAAREGAAIAMSHWRRDPKVWFKEGGSPVSEADIAVDRRLRDMLMAERPDYGWVSEEAEGERLGARTGRGFVVDPIDGTRAFLAGRRSWGVAVAVIEDGRPIAGALVCPAKERTYLARSGGGARVNGAPIMARAEVERPVMAGPRSWIDRMPDGYSDGVEIAPYVPSLAYRIALVADGGIDGTYIRASAHDWDLAASDVVLSEAGGALLRADGEAPIYGRDNARHGMLVAGSAAQLPHMLAMVRRTED